MPLLSPNSSSLPLVSRKTPTALNFQSSSAAAPIAPPLQAFFASPAAGSGAGADDGSLRLRLNACTRSLMVRNCDDSGGSSVSATRQASSWPETSPRAAAAPRGVGQRLQLLGMDQRVAGGTAHRRRRHVRSALPAARVPGLRDRRGEGHGPGVAGTGGGNAVGPGAGAGKGPAIASGTRRLIFHAS